MDIKYTILITNVDSLLGYAIAYKFLHDWKASSSNQSKKPEFRLLCHHKEGLEELEKMGGKIFEFENYTDKETLQKLLEYVSYVMYLPETSTATSQEGKVLFECAKEANVDYLAMFSFVGLNDKMKKSFKHLNQLYQLEQEIPKYFNKDSYCIFQSTLWHQFFYFFGPTIEDHNEIFLPVHKDVKWGTIDLLDLLDAVFNLFTNKHIKEKNQIMFRFTPTKMMETKSMIEAAKKGLGRDDLRYERVDSNELAQYLGRIHNDNRFRQRPDHDHFVFPLGQYLNQDVIGMLMEYFELIDTETPNQVCHDLEKALDKKPKSIQDFFKHNKDQFRKLK